MVKRALNPREGGKEILPGTSTQQPYHVMRKLGCFAKRGGGGLMKFQWLACLPFLVQREDQRNVVWSHTPTNIVIIDRFDPTSQACSPSIKECSGGQDL